MVLWQYALKPANERLVRIENWPVCFLENAKRTQGWNDGTTKIHTEADEGKEDGGEFQRATINDQRTTIIEQLTTGNVGCHVSLIGDAWSTVNGCQSFSHDLPYRPVQFPRGIGSIGVIRGQC